MKRTVVLGAGPVGLAAAEILRADLVIGEKPGGASALRGLAPTYLWRTVWTERFVRDLGADSRPRTVRFGWVVPGGKLSDVATPQERLAYYRRSRGLKPDAIVAVPPSAASSGRPGEIPTFDVSIDQLVAGLLQGRETVEGRVNRITFGEDGGNPFAEVYVDGLREPVRASALINTLPAPVFRKLTGSTFPSLYAPGPKCFVTGQAWSSALHKELKDARRGRGRRFFYVADPSTPFDRVKLLPDASLSWGPFSYEFNAPAPPPGFLNAVNGSVAVSAPLQIPTGAPEVERVEWGGVVWNVGRLARWRHGIRLHDAIEELYAEGRDE